VNVLYNIERFREIDKAQILEFLYILRAIHIELDDHQHDVLRTDLLEISRTYTISSYDAAYIEVALRKNLPIATLDRKLMQVAEKAGIKILTLS
jgi:predicted nucleic acid-binding protein